MKTNINAVQRETSSILLGEPANYEKNNTTRIIPKYASKVRLIKIFLPILPLKVK